MKSMMNKDTFINAPVPLYDYDEMISFALETWYPEGHSLHMDCLHPAMGLAGEVGEWINKHKKDKFKPGFVFTKEDELDELGDIWYYLRILIYQSRVSFNYLSDAYDSFPCDFETLVMEILNGISRIFRKITVHESPASFISPEVEYIYEHFLFYLTERNISLDELTELNWQKLKPGSERGEEWTKAWK